MVAFNIPESLARQIQDGAPPDPGLGPKDRDFLRIFLSGALGCRYTQLSEPSSQIYEVFIRVRIPKIFVIATVIAVAAMPALASRVHRAPTSGHTHSSRKSHIVPKAKKMHGQQAIDTERVTAIQTALIREHYLTGEPSARWDNETQAAMLKFQADQGWQTRLTPDSRALIKLGLGPDHSKAINGAGSSGFNTLSAPAAAQSSGFVAASGVSH